MTVLLIDTETYSSVPIKDGTFAYAEKVETMLLAWAIDDGPVSVWDLTAEVQMPPALKLALGDPKVKIVMHNSIFDRTMLCMSPCINIPASRIHDTMVQALSHSLPGALGKLCQVLSVPVDQAKDKRGHTLIRLFCMPRPANQKLRRATRVTHPKEWAEFVEYARLDVEAMRVVYKKLPMWNYTGKERELWEIDQKIADRGVHIDLELARAAVVTIEREQASLSHRTQEATEGAVERTTQRNKLLDFISSTYGVKFPDLTSSMVEKALNDENLPQELRDLLSIRAEASMSSTAKYKRFIAATSKDGRLRGMLQFNGASRTGRASGRIVQLHNLLRPTMEPEKIETGIASIKADCTDLLYDNVMEVVGNAVRGCIVAAPGKKLLVADLSNIEGRIGAWYGDERWKLDAFRAYDAGTGHDLYNLAYAKAFRIDVKDVTKDQRQQGKTMELAFGFQGGVGAFVTFAAAFNTDLIELADKNLQYMPNDVLAEAEQWWVAAGEQGMRQGLEHDAFIVCDSLKRLWRRAHPGIVNAWTGVDNLIQTAMAGHVAQFGKLKADKQGNWLRLMLPSGRCLCYVSPRIDEKGFSYLGVNPYSRKWGRVRTYAGKVFENVVQATARDVLMEGLALSDKFNYNPILHVHDEIICEVEDDGAFSSGDLVGFMTADFGWTAGLPLAAKGEEMYRYRKAA